MLTKEDRTMKFLKLIMVLLPLSLSGVIFGSILPEGSHRAGLADQYEAALEKNKTDIGLQNSDGYRLWAEYNQTFGRVSEAQEWCNGLLVQFNINVDFLFDHCGWTQSGRYGSYSYATRFLVFYDFPGQPRFFFEQYSSGGGGGGY
jgi:hypothetical protein